MAKKFTVYPSENRSSLECFLDIDTPFRLLWGRRVTTPGEPGNTSLVHRSLIGDGTSMLLALFDFVGFIFVLFIFSDSPQHTQGCRYKETLLKPEKDYSNTTSQETPDAVHTKDTVSYLYLIATMNTHHRYGS